MDNADGSPRDKGEIRDPYDPERLAQANSILSTFLPSLTLTAGPLGHVKDHAALLYEVPARPATADLPERPARTARQAVFPNATGSSIVGSGGRLRFTELQERAIATLIRFVRGRTRRPLAWWAACFPAATYRAVIATTYDDDPEKTACMWCGERIEDAGDWFGSNRWDQGPCCGLRACVASGRAKRAGDDAGTLDELLAGLGGVDDRMIYRGVTHGELGETIS